jgi:hypothetical protein
MKPGVIPELSTPECRNTEFDDTQCRLAPPDATLIELGVQPNKRRLGQNAIVTAPMTAALAGARPESRWSHSHQEQLESSGPLLNSRTLPWGNSQ